MKFIFLILIFPFLVSTAAAQKSDDDVIKINTQLVSFEVSVTDKNGNPVRGLKAEDFRVFEDGVERKIDFFQPVKKDTRPLSLVFALDVSGSMTERELRQLQFALQNFVDRLADYKSYFAVMTFGMRVKTVQSFTNRRDKLEKTFDKILRDQDGLSTHAYDAVDDAVRLLRKKSPPTIANKIPRRAVILITDGFPVGDTVAPETVIERANDNETAVYAVLLPSFSRLQFSKKPLLTPLEASNLIDKTGGKSFYATANNFEPLFKELAEEITASYALAFYPDETSDNSKPRRVRIETSDKYTIKQNRTEYKTVNSEK